MAQVELDDQVFKAAQRRAAEDGYTSVNEYIADVLVHDIGESVEDFDHLFTSERLAELERISAEIKAGGKKPFPCRKFENISKTGAKHG